MDKAKFFQILYVALIVGVIAFIIFLVFWLKSESAMCLKEPLEYYAEKLGTQCYCIGK